MGNKKWYKSWWILIIALLVAGLSFVAYQWIKVGSPETATLDGKDSTKMESKTPPEALKKSAPHTKTSPQEKIVVDPKIMQEITNLAASVKSLRDSVSALKEVVLKQTQKTSSKKTGALAPKNWVAIDYELRQ